MKKVKKRYTVKTKSRIFVFFLLFGISIFTLGFRLFNNLYQINQLKKEKIVLENKINDLTDEKEALEADIEKLSDSDYIARYVREKYLYSRPGELIIRISE